MAINPLTDDRAWMVAIILCTGVMFAAGARMSALWMLLAAVAVLLTEVLLCVE